MRVFNVRHVRVDPQKTRPALGEITAVLSLRKTLRDPIAIHHDEGLT